VIMCSYAVERRDPSGQFQYYCARFMRRMDLDFVERCRTCEEYLRFEL
jgi:hypothetical protein